MPTPTSVQISDGTNNQPVVPTTVDFSFTAASSAGTTALSPAVNLGYYTSAQFYTVLQGVTGGTLDVYLQYSPDSGTTWVDLAHWPQLAAAASPVTRTWPFMKEANAATPVTVGTGTSPALAANTQVPGDWGDRIRVLYVTGSGTSLGSAQVIKAVFSR
jgi:hypothetical protein